MIEPTIPRTASGACAWQCKSRERYDRGPALDPRARAEALFTSAAAAPRRAPVAYVGPWRGKLRGWMAQSVPDTAPTDPISSSTDALMTTAAVAKLRTALRLERRLGRAGHPAYDLARHLRLQRALVVAAAQARSRPSAGPPA